MTIKPVQPEITGRLRSQVVITSAWQCVAELVQNSIDAGASCVSVFVDCGSLLINVKDDGTGVAPEDMYRLGQRYATSKMHDMTDLNRIQTYGFKGEALASIGAISLLTVTSRHKDYRATSSLRVHNSERLYVGTASTRMSKPGTDVTVRSLFANMPVRRRLYAKDHDGNNNNNTQFSKESITRQVRDCLLEIALSIYPFKPVTFVFRTESGLIMNLPVTGQGSVAGILKYSLGGAVNNMTQFSQVVGMIKCQGMICWTTGLCRPKQYIFINKRKVLTDLQKMGSDLLLRSKTLQGDKAEAKGQPEHASFVIHIEAPLAIHDLCQDPSKIITSLENFSLIKEAVVKVLQSTCQQHVHDGLTKLSQKRPCEDNRHDDGITKWTTPIFKRPERKIGNLAMATDMSSESHVMDTERVTVMNHERISRCELKTSKLICQVNDRFILLRVWHANQHAKKLILVDQHAADERVRLEKMINQFCVCAVSRSRNQLLPDLQQAVVGVPLNVTIRFPVSTLELEGLSKYSDQMAFWGIKYVIDTSDVANGQDMDHMIVITEWPEGQVDRCACEPRLFRQVVLEHVHDLLKGDVSKVNLAWCEQTNDVHKLASTVSHCMPSGMLKLFKSRACRSAIMFGDPLRSEQCQSLINNLAKCKFPFQCAHGRPCMIPIMADLNSIQTVNY
ncbi:hypothetical protein V1514DRAFT_280741 [Lipomyces japonicus]|uniref:uncharacterized protein n=1 Tax=Lipomyces japonicus TaxID=56871 RepID=UPI0034CF376A